MDIDTRPKGIGYHIKTITLLAVALGILLMPQIYTGLLGASQKGMYSTGTLVITNVPEVSFPEDWQYCYIDDSTISVSMVFINEPQGNAAWASFIVQQMARAGIEIAITGQHWLNETSQSYYDRELETLGENTIAGDSSQVCVIYTNLRSMPDTSYTDLGGYSRVSKHTAVVLVPILLDNFGIAGIQAIALHEVGHCLGYWHSSNSKDVMYPQYDGTNNGFTASTVSEFYRLHHG